MGVFKPVISGNQIIRLAASRSEIEAAQRLRYRVFYEEMGAHPMPEMAARGSDFDRFDDVCDHLIVIDRSNPHESNVVGTYRFMRRSHADAAGGFYSADEYDLSPLRSNGGEIMELGRSCVEPSFRTRHTMQLLWRGIAEYIVTHDIDLMFGCASFPGTDISAIAEPLSYLYHNHLAPDDLRPRAVERRYCSLKQTSVDLIDPKKALAQLPPLIKGYLRLGAFVGDGAVIDHQFNTTDVCIVVQTDRIADRYANHYALDSRTQESVLRKAS
ncbi:MAG: GNAT family N-acyltransferase [Rhodospirillaceae bacterium]